MNARRRKKITKRIMHLPSRNIEAFREVLQKQWGFERSEGYTQCYNSFNFLRMEKGKNLSYANSKIFGNEKNLHIVRRIRRKISKGFNFSDKGMILAENSSSLFFSFVYCCILEIRLGNYTHLYSYIKEERLETD